MRQANYIKSGSMILFAVRTLVRAFSLSAKAGTLLGAGLALAPAPGWCGTPPQGLAAEKLAQTPATPNRARELASELDLPPEVIEGSPVLQRWRRQVPNVLQDIENDPSFKTRVRLGFSQFPSAGGKLGWNAGVEDVFVGRTGLTVSGDYQA